MPGAPRRPPDPRRIAAIAIPLLAVVALHCALAWLSVRPEPRVFFGDETRYWSDGQAIAGGGSWRPDPIWPVLYPHLLALVFAASGGLAAVATVQWALLLAAALLWADVARRLTGSTLAGAVAGLLLLLDPQVAAFAHYVWPEVVHLFLFAAALWLAIRAEGRPLPLAGVGLLLALAVLTKKLLWPFLPIFVWPAIFAGGAGQSRVRRAAFLAAGFVAGLLPAAIAFGPYAVSPVSSAVFNFWVGLNDSGRRSFSEPIVEDELARYESSGSEARERDRATAARVEERFAATGAARLLGDQLRRQYFRLFDKDSFFTEQLPGGDVHRGGGGYRRPPGALAAFLRGWSYAIYGAALVAAVVGFVLFPPGAGSRPERADSGRWLGMLAAFLAFNLAIFLFVHVKSRYRIPMLPVLDLWAGVAIAWAAGRFGRTESGRSAIGGARLAVAALALAGLGICFAG